MRKAIASFQSRFMLQIMQLATAVFSLFTLAARRLWHQRLLMACLLVGLIAAVGLMSSIPLYTDAVQNRVLQGDLTEAGTHRPPPLPHDSKKQECALQCANHPHLIPFTTLIRRSLISLTSSGEIAKNET